VNDLYVCRKIKLHSYLLENGFKPYSSRPDKYDNERLVWLYKKSEKLSNTIEKYYKEK